MDGSLGSVIVGPNLPVKWANGSWWANGHCIFINLVNKLALPFLVLNKVKEVENKEV